MWLEWTPSARTFVHYRPVFPVPTQWRCWIQQTDSDHDHGWRAYVIMTAISLTAAPWEWLSSCRDYVTTLDNIQCCCQQDQLILLTKTLAPVDNCPTDSISFHVLVSFVSLAISCLSKHTVTAGVRATQLCTLSGSHWSWTVHIPSLVSSPKPSLDITDFGYDGPFRLVPKSLLKWSFTVYIHLDINGHFPGGSPTVMEEHLSGYVATFIWAGCPSCHRTNSVKALKETQTGYRLR